MQTNNGKKGGFLKGKSHHQGGIKAIITDINKPIELESGEVIINKHAATLHKKQLSEINQSAGGGIPIYNKGGEITKSIHMKHISQDIYGDKYICPGKEILDLHDGGKKYEITGVYANGLNLKVMRGVPEEGLLEKIMGYEKIKENFLNKSISIQGYNNENPDHYIILCLLLNQIGYEKEQELKAEKYSLDEEVKKIREKRVAKGRRIATLLELEEEVEKMNQGGEIPDNYKGKTSEELWEQWTLKQKAHFIKDHYGKNKKDAQLQHKKYSVLPKKLKALLTEHRNDGQYEKGGKIKYQATKKRKY